ncbi:MAG: aspartyl/glutamyl-tRNA amidotransferase subunit C [Methanomassiliicoccales archaeon]|jgi:aspartyl-tRNA(Asn)/glutamyl-tRNA(Gln) amidotransferase subunit C|nr:aspartyl/glutamyl-tRNA amidotransferase subunit C [Methanomassiliicoccales archaeon]
MDKQQVNEIARIARLILSKEEIEEFSSDLEDILNYFSVLDEAPTRDDFMLNPVLIENIMRDDEQYQVIDPEVLRRSMRVFEGYVRGPRLS